MDKNELDCPHPECFFCVMKESNPNKRRASVAKFFKDLPSQDDESQVLAVSGLWNTAMTHPNDPEFIKLGIFQCMAALIWKGIKNRQWLAKDQNVYIPYYAAHIIGSYTMNIEEFAESAVQAGVIPPLVQLLCGKLTWVEQRVSVRALGHLATYDSTFFSVASSGEVLESAIHLALNAVEIVYTHFFQFVDKRLSYHCDLLTRGMGGLEMESRKAEEWASQLQCWSLQLINCFAFKPEFLPTICKPDFLIKLPGMWGGLVNESSPSGVGLLRTICRQKIGRLSIAGCPSIIEDLCHIARSSDDWQCMAIDCLLWLLQDPNTRYKVIDKATPALVDLTELPNLRDHKKLGELVANALLQDSWAMSPVSLQSSLNPQTKQLLWDLAALRQKLKWEKEMPKEDLHIKQAAALVIKLEGNSKFSAGDIAGAAAKYTEALSLCPVKAKKERVVLHSNRAQCSLLVQDAKAAISDTTRALCLHNPVNRHSKSLWRRAQAYDLLGHAKESLLDAIMFINECSQAPEGDPNLKQNTVPDYAERLVKKHMQSVWLFKEAAERHGEIHYDEDGDRDADEDKGGEAENSSEWETASESDMAREENQEESYSVDSGWQSEDQKEGLIRAPPVLKGVTLEDLLIPHNS